jgi:hypothetical protein
MLNPSDPFSEAPSVMNKMSISSWLEQSINSADFPHVWNTSDLVPGLFDRKLTLIILQASGFVSKSTVPEPVIFRRNEIMNILSCFGSSESLSSAVKKNCEFLEC